jgi:hypothetical protein
MGQKIMKDRNDDLTPDLFEPVPEFEGISYTLYADHEREIINLVAHRNNAALVLYDQEARDFWHDYVAELKINGFNADDALETMWEQYDEL